MGNCDGCIDNEDCIESCIDCECASCSRRGAKDDCLLGPSFDHWAPDEDDAEERDAG